MPIIDFEKYVRSHQVLAIIVDLLSKPQLIYIYI